MRAALAVLLALPAAAATAAEPAALRNLDPGIAYVGDAACASCHRREARSFPETAMGRSFSLPDKLIADPVAVPPGGVTYFNEKSRRRYEVLVEDGRLVHRESRLDEQGRVGFSHDTIISYVLGSGDRGQTFLIQQGSRLYQSAIAYRPHRDGWGMAAGFEQLSRYTMRRPVTAPCLFCHTNRADHIEGTLNEYRVPIFDGLAIGCERCHGPGALHVEERRSLPPTATGVDTSIVNPARLEPRLRDQVCFQCHLQGSVRLVKAGRRPHDFRPGTPLSDVFAVFHAVREGSGEGGIVVVSHVERLRQSRCWSASGGKIHCLTCHDPHRTPRGDDAVRQFSAACLGCHRLEGCLLDEAARSAGGRAEDCVRCHMAKVPPSDAPHTLFTDHRIARRPRQVPRPVRPGPGGHQRLVNYLEGARGSARDLGLAYLIFATAEGDPRHAEQGSAILEPLLELFPDDIDLHRMMAAHYTSTGRTGKARAVLEDLVQRAPQMAEFRVELARLYSRQGRADDALALLEAAVSEDPSYAPARLTYGDLLAAAGRADEAEAQHRAALDLDPSMAAAHARLGDHALRRGEAAAAHDAYVAALLLDPDLAGARIGLARWHLERGDAGAAAGELRRALAATRDAGARITLRFDLAKVLASAGRLDEARIEVGRVLEADPDHAGARALASRLDLRSGSRGGDQPR